MGNFSFADYTLRTIPAESEDEAHFIAALLNSAPSVAALYYSSTGVQTQRYHAGDAEKVAIGSFNKSSLANELAKLSKKCHAAARKDDWDTVRNLEVEIDKKASEYWKLAPTELREIKHALGLIGEMAQKAVQSSSEENEE